MFKGQLYKSLFAAIGLLLALQSGARQLHTVADGDWFSTSVWYNQLIPGSVNDTIEILNHVSINGFVVLAEADVLTIDANASLCGADTLEMFNNARLNIYGYFGSNVITMDGAGDTIFLAVHGQMDLGDGFIAGEGTLTDIGGCITLHNGYTVCNPVCTFDSSIYLHYNNSIVTFEPDTTAAEGTYEYYFGDGDSSGLTTFYQVHNYADTGYYHVMVTFEHCCKPDTVYATVHITDLYTGISGPAWCNLNQPFIKSAIPADAQLQLAHTFCTDISGSIKLYNNTGSEVYIAPFTTNGGIFAANIPTAGLPAASYILSIETAQGCYRQRIVVMH